MKKTQIPLIDLNLEREMYEAEVMQTLTRVIKKAHYIMGEEVRSFEVEFAQYIDAKHAISVGNGTDALVIALEALGIGCGDEVITTPFTFFSTAESIALVGATPVFVDVELDSFNMDPSLLEEKITAKTKAILVVHLFGQPAEMDEISAVAKKNSLFVIEDACQAVDSEYKSKRMGTFGDIACFSFFPTKNLGCFGDGGMIVTNSDKLAVLCKALRNHGSGINGEQAYEILHCMDTQGALVESCESTLFGTQKYYNYIIGHNSRLDEIQAAVLRIKLRYLDVETQSRREHAETFNKALTGSAYKTPSESANTKHCYHMYILQHEERDAIVEHLKNSGIATGIYYPIPLHLQKAFEDLEYKYGDFPNAEYLAKRTFAVPIYPKLTEEQMQYITGMLLKY